MAMFTSSVPYLVVLCSQRGMIIRLMTVWVGLRQNGCGAGGIVGTKTRSGGLLLLNLRFHGPLSTLGGGAYSRFWDASVPW